MIKSKGFVLVFILLSSLFNSQKTTAKTLAEIDRISFENPDSALILINKLEPNLDDVHFKSRLLLSKGNAYSVKHLSSESISVGFEAYKLALKSKDSLMMINSLSFLGNQYYIIKLNSEALKYLTKAEGLLDHISNKDAINYVKANIYFVKGLIYKDNLDPNFALDYFNRAIRNYSQEKLKQSSYNLLITQIQKAYSLGDLNRNSEAISLLYETISAAEKERLKEVSDYAEIALGNIYTKTGDYHRSNEILLAVEKNIDKKENSSMILEIYEAITNNSFLTKDFKSYTKFSEEYEKSLLNNENMELKTISDLAHSNLETVNEKMNHDETLFIGVIGVIILTFFCLLYLFYINFEKIKLKLSVFK